MASDEITIVLRCDATDAVRALRRAIRKLAAACHGELGGTLAVMAAEEVVHLGEIERAYQREDQGA